MTSFSDLHHTTRQHFFHLQSVVCSLSSAIVLGFLLLASCVLRLWGSHLCLARWEVIPCGSYFSDSTRLFIQFFDSSPRERSRNSCLGPTKHVGRIVGASCSDPCPRVASRPIILAALPWTYRLRSIGSCPIPHSPLFMRVILVTKSLPIRCGWCWSWR